MGREEIEHVLGRFLGAKKVVWLERGIAGDDTHGHVDDIARFVAPNTVVAAVEPDPADPNHEPLRENLKRLRKTIGTRGQPLRVVPLPMPSPVVIRGQRVPASYANFYIFNGIVLVPTFNQPNDRLALNTLGRRDAEAHNHTDLLRRSDLGTGRYPLHDAAAAASNSTLSKTRVATCRRPWCSRTLLHSA